MQRDGVTGTGRTAARRAAVNAGRRKAAVRRADGDRKLRAGI